MTETQQTSATPAPERTGRDADTLSSVLDGNGARILSLSLMMTAVFIAAMLAVGAATGHNDWTRAPARILMLALTLASFVLMLQRRIVASVRLFLLGGTAVILLQSMLVSGVRTPILMTIPGLLVLSGWFLGRRYTFGLAGAALSGVGAMALLERHALIVPQPRSLFDEWSMLTFMLIAMAVIGVFGHGRFVAALRRTEHGAAELQRELDARHRSEARLRETLENSPDVAVQWFDRAGRVRYWNAASESLYGYTAAEAEGRTLDQVGMSAEETAQFRAMLERLEREGGRLGPNEHRLRRKDGSECVVLATMFRIPGFDDEPLFVCMDIDVTAARRTESALRARNESLQLVNQLSSRIYGMRDVVSMLGRTIDTITEVARTPYVVAHLIEPDGHHLRLVASNGFDPDYERIAHRVDMQRAWASRAFRTGEPLFSRRLADEPHAIPELIDTLGRSGLGAGVVIPLFCRGEPAGCMSLFYREGALDELGEAERETFVAIGRTLSMAVENARHLEDLHRQARHDSLTGLPNRVRLHERFAAMVDRLRAGERLAVLLLDLDRFKDVNDTLGHHTGDRLLVELAGRLKIAAGEDAALTCRLGGDEFAVLVPVPGDSAAAVDIAIRIRDTLERPFEVEGISLGVGASVGVSIYPEHGRDSHELLRAADVAMYRAKNQGLGVSLYDRSSDVNSPERLALIGELAQALQRSELVMHYQPKLALATGAVCGFEALVRWQHPRLGLLYPGAFVQLVEASELVHAFTRAVIQQVLRDKARLDRLGHRQPVGVNLSARNLVDDRCVEDIERLVRAHGLPFEAIEIELTETAIMHDPEHAARLLDRLDARGVTLSIDDFGTGYSSLALLKRLPLDALKIDQSFVRDMNSDEQDAVIVQSIVALAHNLGLQVVAEGVEDETTLARLREIGCDVAQGYLLSRPLPLEELVQWLDAHRAQAQPGLPADGQPAAASIAGTPAVAFES